MKRSTMQSAAAKLRAQRRHKSWRKVVTFLAAIVVFVTTYMLILPAITMERETVCGLEEHTHTEECYTLSETLTCSLAEDGQHTHTPDCYETGRTLACGMEEHVHTEECYAQPEPEEPPVETDVLEESPVEADDPVQDEPETELPAETDTPEEAPVETGDPDAPGQTYAYEDDVLSVEVTLPVGSGVPEDAVLAVRPITGQEEDEAYDYDELTRQAVEAVSGQTSEIVFYDISFYTPEQEYIPVSDAAVVTFRFKEAVLSPAAGEVTVLHYPEDAAPVALETVEIRLDENDSLTELEFLTQGFSVYAVVLADEPAAQADEGNTFTLTYNGSTITFYVVDGDGKAITGDYSKYNITAAQATKYLFSDIVPSIDDYAYSGAKYNNSSVVSVATNNFYNGFSTVSTTFQFYVYEPIQSGQWYSSYSGNLEVTLTYTAEATEPTDYTGDWAIVNLKSGSSSGVAMMAGGVGGNDSANRAGQTVTVEKEDDGTLYVLGATVWHFEKQTDGTYYISTTVGGKTQYLTIGASSSAAVTLSDTPQAITVTEGSGTYKDMVRLTNASQIAVNLFGGNVSQGFGSYNDSGANEWQTLYKVTNGDITYDINTLTLYSRGTSWQDTPTLTSTVQSVDENTTALFGQPEGYDKSEDGGVAGIANLYRFNIAGVDDLLSSPAYTDKEGAMNGAWYGEARFDGWTYTENGTTYLLDPAAPVTKTDDGVQVAAAKKITSDDVIETIDEITITLPLGTKLTGHWTEVSNVVTFFVNYKGTILDVEGDVSGRRQDTFTKAVAVGHVFYGKQKVGADDKFASNVNAAITAAFRPDFDEDDPSTQIVIENLRICTKSSDDGSNYETEVSKDSVHGANSHTIEKATLQLLKKTGRTVQLSTANGGNPEIDSTLCDQLHYEIRWYVMKEQTNTWHVDGVLVAKTAEIAVTKTFTGLDDATISGLIKYSATETPKLNNGTQVYDTAGNPVMNVSDIKSFNIPVALGADSQEYLTMTTKLNNTAESQYEYLGPDQNIHSYHWTLNAITHEKYTLSEDNYEVDGYDVTTIIVHYYTDETGKDQIVYTYGDSTKAFETDDSTSDPVVVGGHTTAVSFNNLYTPVGTGALAIVKRDINTGKVDVIGKLQGAVFGLYTDETCETPLKNSDNKAVTATSNANGTAYFSGLEAGTYYLKEIKPPAGYNVNDGVWKVEVTQTPDQAAGKTIATVTVYAKENGAWDDGTVVYNGAATGITDNYTIYDTPDHTTVTVTKTFTGLTNDEIEALLLDSYTDIKGIPHGYYIQFQGNVTASGNIDADEATSVSLTLDQAQRSQNLRTFTWTINNLAVESDGKPITYTVTEYNYLSGELAEKYMDTVVTAKLNTQSVPEVKDPYDPGVSGPYLNIDRELQAAMIYQVQFQTDSSDILELTNHYTNTFDLKLRKVDSVVKDENGEPVTIPGAKFTIYGPYSDSSNVNNYFDYTDPETGAATRYYYITTITSGKDGYAVAPELKLSKGMNTFVYVLDESSAPAGYVPAEPEIITVDVSVDDDNYIAGVLNYEAPNTREEDYVHAALDTVKLWDPDAPPDVKVTLELYRVVHEKRNTPLDEVVDAELVKSIVLDGTEDTKPESDPGWNETTPSKDKIQAYESAPWTATWMNLYSASRDYSDDNPDHYHYFVREVVEFDGYTASYTCTAPEDEAIQTLKVGNKTFDAVLLADMDEAYTVTITNTAYFELPKSGGAGTLPYTIGGTLLMASSLLYGCRLRRSKERRSKQ